MDPNTLREHLQETLYLANNIVKYRVGYIPFSSRQTKAVGFAGHP
jgi:hypothetical protein